MLASVLAGLDSSFPGISQDTAQPCSMHAAISGVLTYSWLASGKCCTAQLENDGARNINSHVGWTSSIAPIYSWLASGKCCMAQLENDGAPKYNSHVGWTSSIAPIYSWLASGILKSCLRLSEAKEESGSGKTFHAVCYQDVGRM